MPDAATAIASLYERARELARQGYGYEDLVFKLGKEFRERFGKPRDDAMAMLRMKVERKGSR